MFCAYMNCISYCQYIQMFYTSLVSVYCLMITEKELKHVGDYNGV
jgi:hypothetical protein